jgi:hypothetical protein
MPHRLNGWPEALFLAASSVLRSKTSRGTDLKVFSISFVLTVGLTADHQHQNQVGHLAAGQQTFAIAIRA